MSARSVVSRSSTGSVGGDEIGASESELQVRLSAFDHVPLCECVEQRGRRMHRERRRKRAPNCPQQILHRDERLLGNRNQDR